MRGVGGRDDDVRARQLDWQLVDPDGPAAEALRERDGPVVAAVGDEDGIGAAGRKRSGGELGGLAGADQQDAPGGEIAEVALRQLDRDRWNGDSLLADGR